MESAGSDGGCALIRRAPKSA